MESRKQSELPQQLGKKIIQALKTQNASSQPKSPIATSSSPVVEDNSFVSKSVSPIGLEVIDHMDFGSQELSLEEPKAISNNKQESYSDPFAVQEHSSLISNTQVQEYGSFITPEESAFSDFEVPESEPVQNNYLLEEPAHNLSGGFYEEYDFDNENYQTFQSQTPPEFEGMESYDNYASEQQIFHEEEQVPHNEPEEDVLTSDTKYYSEHDHSVLDYSTDAYDHDHQFNDESYFSSGFDFTSEENYVEEPISNDDFFYSQQSQPTEDVEDEFNPQIGYNQEDIMPIPKKTPKILDLDATTVDNNLDDHEEEHIPDYIPEHTIEDVVVPQLEDMEEEDTQDKQEISHQPKTSFDPDEEDIVSENIYFEEPFDDDTYNQEQEEDFTEMTKNIYPETKEIKPSKGSPNLEDKRSISFEQASDRDYEKLQERSYDSNKDNRKMDEKISLKEDKEYQKSDEKYFVQHDKDYRRNEDKYYPEMERDYRRYDDKDHHREDRNYENLSKYDNERDYIRYDDRRYEKDIRKQDDRYSIDREKYHSEHPRETMRYEERHYSEPDRDYNRFEIKESKQSKEYRRDEERYTQPTNTYDKFNVRYYDPDKDYHKYDKFPAENEKEYMHRDEMHYYDDREPKHTNRPSLHESAPKSDLYNANVETLIRLVLSLPQGVTKQTGAQIIKQTMEAMGIAINEVLADAQESQNNIRRHIKDSYNTIDEHKMHVRQLEDEIYQYQKKAKDLDDIVSLFVYSDQPKPMR